MSLTDEFVLGNTQDKEQELTISVDIWDTCTWPPHPCTPHTAAHLHSLHGDFITAGCLSYDLHGALPSGPATSGSALLTAPRDFHTLTPQILPLD